MTAPHKRARIRDDGDASTSGQQGVQLQAVRVRSETRMRARTCSVNTLRAIVRMIL